MDSVPGAAADRGDVGHAIDVADESLAFRRVPVGEATPTGKQIAMAAGIRGEESAAVLRLSSGGEMEVVGPDQPVDLGHSDNRFVVVVSDRVYWFTVDGGRFDWPSKAISGGQVRKLGQVASEKDIFLERPGEESRLVGPHDMVDLDRPGVEVFVSRDRIWKLNVQGMIIESMTPTIQVKLAITEAGFNPDQEWQIFLKVAGEPKRPVCLTDVIDLRKPGIEKLRLTPKHVHNGEAPPAPRRDFTLLDADERHLKALGLRSETIVEAGRRWLVIHDYPVPGGFTVRQTLLALEIPPTYPGAQIYGFYAYPPLALASGRVIESTQLRGTLFGVEFHGWSRNRGATPWSPAADNVATQLALADAAMAKEVGE